MKISVIIPAYNAAATLASTLDAALSQTLAAEEILVLDDGSTDGTAEVLESYQKRVTSFRQPNRGVSHARNFLCTKARGDVLAFLDADDLWHPSYLELQRKLIEQYPSAVAYYTEHDDVYGYGAYSWKTMPDLTILPQLIGPYEFLKRYNKTPLSFGMSWCCIRRSVLREMGPQPFLESVTGGEDTYLNQQLPLFGDVVYAPVPLVAYRVIESTLSANRLKMSMSVVSVFEALDGLYRAKNNPDLYHAFRQVFAGRMRNCGKFLMGVRRVVEARNQFRKSLGISGSPRSVVKSAVLWLSTWMPDRLQPRWPSASRPSRQPNSAE